MEKVMFYVDFCFEAGDDEFPPNLRGRYKFGIELSIEEYDELYQVWDEQDNELNSWNSERKGHEELFNKIDGNAAYALNQLLAKYEPNMVNPIEVLWELSEEPQRHSHN